MSPLARQQLLFRGKDANSVAMLTNRARLYSPGAGELNEASYREG